jgi:hypothetical protein
MTSIRTIAGRPEPTKDFIDAYILCKDLKITTKDKLMEIISIYIPLKILGERQIKFIKYIGKDLGYDWK